MSHSLIARRVFGITHETIVRRILRTFDTATPSDLERGAAWYARGQAMAATLAADPNSSVDTLERGACLLSALSPRTDWARNVAGAVAMAYGAEPAGCIGTNVDRARDVLAAVDPFDGLGNGPKVRSFARNFIGDTESVTVDVWACRVADIDETRLGRKGAYDAVAHAYRLAARRRGVAPSTMQAVTWIIARNGRSE